MALCTRTAVNVNPEVYTLLQERKGLLRMLERNANIKHAPQRWQECRNEFDVALTFEERIMNILVHGNLFVQHITICDIRAGSATANLHNITVPSSRWVPAGAVLICRRCICILSSSLE